MGLVKFHHSKIWAWQLSGYPKSVQNNGVGRFVCQLQRLTLHFCKIERRSAGVRQFIEADLLNFAHANPNVVVYLHPHRLNRPFMYGEYLNGRLCRMDLANMDRFAIQRWIEYFRTRSGQRIVRMEQMSRTTTPSIQGIWNPFTNVESAMNVAKFPNEDLSECFTDEQSATDILKQVVKEQRENIKLVK